MSTFQPSMSQKQQQQQLRDVGVKLLSPPSSKDALIKLLKQATNFLCEVEQSPTASMSGSMMPCVNAVVKEELLKHHDQEVKSLLAICICEITRITAPEPPFPDDILRDIFHLIIGTFSGLSDINSPSYARRVIILESLARYRSSVMMLDIECDDLIEEMFYTFFTVINDDHSEIVVTSMQKIMNLIIDESDDVQENLLKAILLPLGRRRTNFSQAARRLAMDVIKHSTEKLESGMKQFLVSSLSGDMTSLNNSVDYHEVIYDIYRSAPKILHGIVSYITGELLSDVLDIRMKTVQLLGELFALPGVSISEAFQPLFSEFLKRLTDRDVKVRLSVIEHLKNCIIADPTRSEASSIIKSLCDRLLDYNENVRKQVVTAIYDMACNSCIAFPTDTFELVASRLRDKSYPVRKHTMEKLADIYRLNCLRIGGSTTIYELHWIPGKLLRCLYDKDFRPETIEFILCGYLFPPEISIDARLKHWTSVFSGFDKVELKALKLILMQKQRLQQQMKRFLSLRQAYQEGDKSDIQKIIHVCCRSMARLFSESVKAEEGFLLLNQLKDIHVWKMLTTLLDPSTGLNQAWSCRNILLNILGENHPLYDFMGALTLKCSYLLFNKDFVKEALVNASAANFGDTNFLSSSMNLLAMIACFTPQLFSGFEENLIHLLKDENEMIREDIVHFLAIAGGSIRSLLAKSESSFNLFLERLCVEGSRKQAKYSVQALTALNKDDDLKPLSVVYKRLVDMLDDRRNLPAIIQSLGCIAQLAMPIYETREDEIFAFIKHKILEPNNKMEGTSTYEPEQTEVTEDCLLKIFSIKALVKSILPSKDAQLRPQSERVIKLLKNILSFGDIYPDIKLSPVDKSHMRLASAKAVIRLSRRCDHLMPLDVFYLTLWVLEDICSNSRKVLIKKVHSYIKEQLLDPKYACAVLFSVNQYHSLEYDEGKTILFEIFQICQQRKVHQPSSQSYGNSTVDYPECILLYLVHALAHHPFCPSIDEHKDIKAYEAIYWRLHLFLSVYLHGVGDAKSRDDPNLMANCIKMVSIFHTIKSSEDAVDHNKSKASDGRISHTICDLGLSIIKDMVEQKFDSSGTHTLMLPSNLYKPAVCKEGGKVLDTSDMTWLGDEDILVNFKALMFEDKDQVSDTDKENVVLGNLDVNIEDMPLGKMMKLMKSQRSEKNRSMERHRVASNKKVPAKNITVNDLKREHIMQVGEITQHTESSECERLSTVKSNGQASVSTRKKQSNGIARLTTQIPKCRKHECTVKVPFDSHANEAQTIDEGAYESKIAEAVNDDVVKATTLGGDDLIRNYKSVKGSAKKRKISSGMAKCSSRCVSLNKEELIGSTIKVWWPMDKEFYEGIVQSYDPVKKKHEIIYNDGDVEILDLNKQKWEHVNSSGMPKKKENVQLPLYKEISQMNGTEIRSHSSGKKLRSSITKVRKTASKKLVVFDTNKGSEKDQHNVEVKDVSSGMDDDATNPNQFKYPLKKQKQFKPLPEVNLESTSSHSAEDSNSDNEPLIVWRTRIGKKRQRAQQ